MTKRIKQRIKVTSIFKRAQELSAIKKKTAPFIILLIAGVSILAISLLGKIPLKIELHDGDVSIKDMYAPFDFSYAWGIDAEKTKAAQKEAVSGVYDIYIQDKKQRKDIEARLNAFFDSVTLIRDFKKPVDEQLCDELKKTFSIEVSLNNLNGIISFEDLNKLRAVSISAIMEVLSSPIIAEADRQKLHSNNIKKIFIKTESDRLTVEVADLLLPSPAKQLLNSYIDKNFDGARAVKSAISDILSAQINSNLSYSEKETSAARKQAEESVKPFYNMNEVKKGEIIILKGERATTQTLAKLSAIESETKKQDNIAFISSFALILLLMFFILVIYTELFEPQMLKDNAGMLLIGTLLVIIAIMAKVIVLTPLPSYFIPAACISMLFTLLIGNTVVFPLIITGSVVISAMSGAELNIFIVSYIGATVAVFVIKKARRRIHLLKAGLYVGMSNFISISSLGILNGLEPEVYLNDGLWGLAGGILAAGMTMFCLPVIERTLHLTTDIGLLELADLNHPLVKEMAVKAPGTYHHSFVVGNLAEAACDAIGANPLLARVGAYYHDIGKTEKAEYFSENQSKRDTSHKDLTPYMSSLIITSHVKDGVEMARRYNLPKSIINMIEQHHGSGLIHFFYQKALEKEGDEETVKEEGFRYPGPKPQMKETAIVLLADSVEAASRTLTEPTPARLDELVRRIINNKFIDRQLDECDLTLKEIDTICKSFVHILVGIYHARVEYPGNNNANKKNKNDKASPAI